MVTTASTSTVLLAGISNVSPPAGMRTIPLISQVVGLVQSPLAFAKPVPANDFVRKTEKRMSKQIRFFLVESLMVFLLVDMRN